MVGMTSQVLLLTGTSTGIGRATAVEAARAGFTVVATMRDTARAGALQAAADAANVHLDIQQLDVTAPDSIERCIAGVRERYGRLDALVNNAGAGHVGTLEAEPLDEVRTVMEVNFFGVLAVTRAALPLLRETAGRLVVVSSVGGIIGQPFNEAYCAAKFAVEGFFESLAPVAASLGVSVTIVEPGAVSTEFVANAGVTGPQPTDDTPYESAFAAYIERTRVSFDPANAQTAEGVAAVIVAALTDANPPVRVQTSDAARRFVGLKLADLDGSIVQGATRGWIS